jgi:hypothetical protein
MRTIEALVNGTFDFEFQESIKTDFQVAGIEHIYQSFLKFNDYVTLQREGLLDEIDRLEIISQILEKQFMILLN